MNLTQLALEIGLQDDATFANYCNVNNKMAYDCIVQLAQGFGEQFTYLWGREGVGKTHLLQAACHLASEQENSAVYLSLDNINHSLDIDSLQGLENITLVCLDNIHALQQNLIWEEGVFHLFNKIINNQHKLLVTSNIPPTKLQVNLADLKSRLSWGVVYQLQPLEDADKLMVLKQRAKDRGLELDDTVGWFLLRRCARGMSYLFKVLDDLDKASLAKQRKLTIPFVKQVLKI